MNLSFCISDFSSTQRFFTLFTSSIISNCFFTRFNIFNGEGGIVFVDYPTVSLIIINSIFYNCSSFSNGAVIFFRSNFFLTLKNVCGSNCTSFSPYASFAYIYLNSVSNCSIESSTINLCSPNFQSGYSIWIFRSLYNIKFFNSSFNKNLRTSSLSIIDFYNYFCSYSTFFNNSANGEGIIQFQNSQSNTNFTNFVENYCYSTGILSSYSSNNFFYNCTFYNNFQILFYSTNFYVYYSTIIHFNYIGSFISYFLNYNESKTIFISHLNTKYCENPNFLITSSFNKFQYKKILRILLSLHSF